MWFFDRIAITIGVVSGWFGDIEGSLGDIPLIGPIAAAPFGWVATAFSDVAGDFQDASLWADGVISDISTLVGKVIEIIADVLDIQTWKSAIGDTWDGVVDIATDFSSAVFGVLGSTWDWVVDLATDFSSAVFGVLGSTWDWVVDLATDFSGAVFGVLGSTWTDLTNMLSDFVGWVGSAIDNIQISFSYAGTLVTATIPALISETYYNAKDIYDNFVDYVYAGVMSWSVEQYEYLIATLFNTLDTSWTIFEDHMKWLTGKIIDMVADAAEVFADKIWNLVEKVVEKL